MDIFIHFYAVRKDSVLGIITIVIGVAEVNVFSCFNVVLCVSLGRTEATFLQL